ncbi:MAG: tRNA 2-thiouridine(34) synthase MnmA [bacterium]|nr:tRNA 2-thiouridine(34) synthase MnmA [bacterium]
MSKKTIVVGMSGGVDSSVTALILKEQGFNVIGVIMKVWSGDFDSTEVPVSHSCYGPDEIEDIKDAEKIARKLGIDFHVIDLRDEYRRHVLDYFRKEYSEGRTPNPCVKCNWKIKFGALVEKTRQTGIKFDYFATGHYANVEYDSQKKRYLLKRARDINKDQTYFLSFLTQDQLRHCMFPLGNSTKKDIKEKAKYFDLKLEEKPESQNFAAMGHQSLLEGTSKPGNFIDSEGQVLGQHKGISYYTVGQRKGLGISAKTPLYVTKINKTDNTVILGKKEDLAGSELIAVDLNWIAFETLSEQIEITAKIRYVQKEDPAIIIPQKDGSVIVNFLKEQSAITPGQFIVFYDKDTVIGGGVISKVIK